MMLLVHELISLMNINGGWAEGQGPTWQIYNQ